MNAHPRRNQPSAERLPRTLASILAIALLASFAGCGGGQGSNQPDTGSRGLDLSGWNVILVTLDTTRADRIGCYGRERAGTPRLDALAAEGVLFENAVAQAPITLPTHASIFTGNYPPAHGVRGNGFYTLPEDRTTLAERLSEAGYETGAVTAARVLDRRFGLAQGFRIFDDDPNSMSQSGFSDYTRHAPAVNEAALSVLSQFDKASPYFLWVHYFDPHAPYDPPAEFAKEFPNDYDGKYQAEISHVDDQLGKLLDEIRERGQLERTLVIVTADHGEGLGEHGEQTHGVFVYSNTLHVPLLFWADDALPAGTRRPELIRQIDLMPTVLDLLGLEEADEAHGMSCRDLLEAGDETVSGREDIFSYGEAMVPWYKFGWAPLLQVRDLRWKYIEAPTPELYDLENDPGEKRNVADEHPDVVERMRDSLTSVLAQGSGADGFTESLVTTPEERQKLVELGYVGEAKPLPSNMGVGQMSDLKDPKDWMHLNEEIHRARGLHLNNKTDEAVVVLEAIIEQDKENYEAYAALIEFLMGARRFDQAEARIREVIAFRPEEWRIWMVLGQLERNRAAALQQAGDAVEAGNARTRAVEPLRKAADLSSIEAEPWGRLGSLYFELKRAKEAEEALRRGNAIDPRDMRINSMLGTLLARSGRAAESIPHLEAAVAAAPDRNAGRGLRGSLVEACIAARQFDKAETALRWIEQNFPNDPALPRARAVLEQARKQ